MSNEKQRVKAKDMPNPERQPLSTHQKTHLPVPPQSEILFSGSGWSLRRKLGSEDNKPGIILKR
jgi:hypothetical protein